MHFFIDCYSIHTLIKYVFETRKTSITDWIWCRPVPITSLVSMLFLYMLFFVSNTFISNARLKLTKNKSKAKQHPESELLLFDNYRFSSSTLSSFSNKRCSKNCTKNKWVCINEVIWLTTIKMRLQLKNRSHRYGINRPRLRNGDKHAKYKMCLSTMMVICLKQHLSNIWSSIH